MAEKGVVAITSNTFQNAWVFTVANLRARMEKRFNHTWVYFKSNKYKTGSLQAGAGTGFVSHKKVTMYVTKYPNSIFTC